MIDDEWAESLSKNQIVGGDASVASGVGANSESGRQNQNYEANTNANTAGTSVGDASRSSTHNPPTSSPQMNPSGQVQGQDNSNRNRSDPLGLPPKGISPYEQEYFMQQGSLKGVGKSSNPLNPMGGHNSTRQFRDGSGDFYKSKPPQWPAGPVVIDEAEIGLDNVTGDGAYNNDNDTNSNIVNFNVEENGGESGWTTDAEEMDRHL